MKGPSQAHVLRHGSQLVVLLSLEVLLVSGDWLKEVVPGRQVPHSLFSLPTFLEKSCFALAHVSCHEFLPHYSPGVLEQSH